MNHAGMHISYSVFSVSARERCGSERCVTLDIGEY